MKIIPSVLVFLLAAFLAGFAVSCGGEAQQIAADAFTQAYSNAMADGVIQPDEAALLRQLGKEWVESTKQIDWAAELGKIAGIVLASVFGANFWRNHNLPGSQRTEPQP